MLLLAAAAVTEKAVPTAADTDSMFPWYNWVIIVGIVVILLAFKAYKNKTMT